MSITILQMFCVTNSPKHLFGDENKKKILTFGSKKKKKKF